MTEKLTHRTDLNAWFIQLRWIACGVAVALVVATIGVFHYLEPQVFAPLMILVVALAATNVAYTFLVRTGRMLRRIAELQIITDLVILTSMLHYSGGIENPLSLAYLFHVILSGILLTRRQAYTVALLSFALYSSLAVAELSGVIGHYTLDIFPHAPHGVEQAAQDGASEHEATESGEHDDGVGRTEGEAGAHDEAPAGRIHASHHPLFVISMCALCLFLLLLTAYFITTIMARLRTEERRAREGRQRLERVLDATGAGLVILDRDLKPIWVNEPAARWVGTAGEPTRLEPPESWVGGADDAAGQTLADRRVRSVECERIMESGEKQHFQVTVAPLIDTEGEAYQVVELIQDVTEKKMIEAEMMHTAKMVTLGTMAAGIAHEVGNPLASISTRLQLLETDHDEQFISESLPLLRREIARIERIVHGISQFGRPSRHVWGLVDMNEIVRETVDMVRYNRSSKRSRIDSELAPGLPRVLGVKDQLKQVLLNVGLNALEAMPEGGLVRFRTHVEGGEVKVFVSDTGTGIDDASRDRMFQPFFTSKEKGSGLGLFIVHHLVQAHGGSVEVDSAPGTGTTLTVRLPAHGVRPAPGESGARGGR